MRTAAHLQQGRTAEDLEADHGGDRVAGKPEEGGALEDTEGRGHAGPNRYLPEFYLPAHVDQGIPYQIVITHGYATGGDQDIGLASLCNLASQDLEVIFRNTQVDGDGPTLPYLRGQRVAVAGIAKP